jgi:hypothetical protein
MNGTRTHNLLIPKYLFSTTPGIKIYRSKRRGGKRGMSLPESNRMVSFEAIPPQLDEVTRRYGILYDKDIHVSAQGICVV